MMQVKNAFLLLFTVFFCACQPKGLEKTPETEYVITISTPKGDMKAILYDETPEHKANFIKLVKEGFYDSLLFHRVIEDFMAQGGDPNSKGADANQPLGSGDPGYLVPAEFNPKFFHKKGALAAARQADQVNPEKKSNGSQFYIVDGKVHSKEELQIDLRKLNQYFYQLLNDEEFLDVRTQVVELQQAGNQEGYQNLLLKMKPAVEEKFNTTFELPPLSEEKIEAYTTIGGYPSLDGGYTVFGEVIEGLEVIDKITSVPKGARNRPKEDLPMSMTWEIVPKKDLIEKYGITF